jgi:hypothetical protein
MIVAIGCSADNLVYQNRSTNSTAATSQVLSGFAPQVHRVMETGISLSFSLLQIQNEGVSLDMKRMDSSKCPRGDSFEPFCLHVRILYSCIGGRSYRSYQRGYGKWVSKGQWVCKSVRVGQRNHELDGLPKGAFVRFSLHNSRPFQISATCTSLVHV